MHSLLHYQLPHQSGTFIIIITESALIYHCHLKPVVKVYQSFFKNEIQINDDRPWPSVYDNCLTGSPLPTCAKLSARDNFPSLSAMMPWAVLCLSDQISSVQFSSVAQSCLTLCDPWIAAFQSSLSITNSQTSLRLTSIDLVMPSSHLILCCPLLLLHPIPPSIRVFSNESGILNYNIFSLNDTSNPIIRGGKLITLNL